MEEIAILDYNTGGVYIYPIPSDKNVHEFLKEHHYKESECYYMIAEHIIFKKY